MSIDIQLLRDRYLPILKEYKYPLSLGVCGLLLIVYGLISFLVPSAPDDTLQFEASAQEAPQASLTVDVGGAVVSPNIYRLKEDARVHDALIAAGGLSNTADREWVSKYINLAQKLTDGQKLYIPMKGEATTMKEVKESVTSMSTSGTININTASGDALDTLPGVGAVTAQKIIKGRPYGTVEELRDKKIVSQKVFDQIKERITVY